VAVLQIPMNNITMICLVMLRFEKKNIQFLTSVILKVTTSLLLIYIFLEIYDLGIMGTLWAYLLSSLISIVYLIFHVRRYVTVSFSEALLVKSLKYCLPQFPARIGNIALIYSNRVFMVGVLTISAIGIFSLSLKLASIVQLIYTAFVLAWTPFMFKKRLDADHKVVFKNVLNLASSLIFLLVVLVSLFVVYILEFFISEEFMDASKYVGALCMSFAIMIFREIVDIGPKYMEKTKFISYTFFCSLIVNILCLYFLIPLLGITGVVLSLIITNSSLLAFSWIISNWLYPIPFEYLKFIILAIPAYCISILTMYIDLNIWLKLFLGLALIIFYSWYFVSYYKKFAGNKLFTSGNSIIK
jgi:O-antigen/teichoic acid export membrane protein